MNNRLYPVLIVIVVTICAIMIFGTNAVATCQANSNQSADTCAMTIR